MGFCKLDNRWQVDGQPIYCPSFQTKIQHDSLASEDSGRTEDGVMQIEWVRTDIVKVNLVYPVMSYDELRHLLGLLQGRTFQFTFPDKMTASGTRTISAYASASSYTDYSEAIHGGIVTDVSINVIQR